MAVLVPTEIVTSRTRSKPWLWFNLFSLDAPLVAVLWQHWFSRGFHVAVSPAATVALALTVWIIYATDRLLDVTRSQPLLLTDRHRFHRKHARSLSVAVLLGLFALVITCALLRPILLREGMLLSAVVAIYFLSVHALPHTLAGICCKEVAVGVLFAIGTALAPWSKSEQPLLFLIPVMLFAVLCCLNCAAIEVWEGRTATHAATTWLAANTRPVSVLIAITALVLLVFAPGHHVYAALCVSALGFLWLDVESERLPPDLLRVLADVPLLSPLLLMGLR